MYHAAWAAPRRVFFVVYTASVPLRAAFPLLPTAASVRADLGAVFESSGGQEQVKKERKPAGHLDDLGVHWGSYSRFGGLP